MDESAKEAARVLLDLAIASRNTRGPGMNQRALDKMMDRLTAVGAISVDTETPGQIVVNPGPLLAGTLTELRWLIAKVALATRTTPESVVAELEADLGLR